MQRLLFWLGRCFVDSSPSSPAALGWMSNNDRPFWPRIVSLLEYSFSTLCFSASLHTYIYTYIGLGSHALRGGRAAAVRRFRPNPSKRPRVKQSGAPAPLALRNTFYSCKEIFLSLARTLSLSLSLAPSLLLSTMAHAPSKQPRKQLQVLEFQDLDHVAAAVQSAGEPSTGVAFLDQYSIIVLGDLTRVRKEPTPLYGI